MKDDFMAVFKEGQGIATRIGAVILMTLLGAYSGLCWWHWQIGEAALSGGALGLFANAAFAVGVLLFIGLTAAGIWLSFFRPGTCEFLIEVDTELRKVVWPNVLPLFDPKTQAWGSTYVVIITTVLCTVYIGVVDIVFEWALARHVLVWLLAAN